MKNYYKISLFFNSFAFLFALLWFFIIWIQKHICSFLSLHLSEKLHKLVSIKLQSIVLLKNKIFCNLLDLFSFFFLLLVGLILVLVGSLKYLLSPLELILLRNLLSHLLNFGRLDLKLEDNLLHKNFVSAASVELGLSEDQFEFNVLAIVTFD